VTTPVPSGARHVPGTGGGTGGRLPRDNRAAGVRAWAARRPLVVMSFSPSYASC
jgi:hypothetical protein